MKKTLLGLGLAITSLSVSAETVTLAYQNGWAYTPLYIMQDQGLVEKHAKLAGVDLKAEFRNLGSPGVIRDALIAGQVQFGAVGVPTLIQMHDKTAGDIKAVGNIVSLPMFLNTNDDKIKNVCDYKDSNGKIALPTVKSSVQAVTLQMASVKLCKLEPFALDSKTVSMTHPDGMASLLSGNSEVTGHFTSPPFQHVELEEGKGKVRKLLSSYEVLGGKTSFILLVGSEKWKTSHAKEYDVIVKAFEEAQSIASNSKKVAAETYVKIEKPKESVADVLAQMNSDDVLFDVTPSYIATYADFMFNVKTVKNKADWKALSFPNLHSKNGS